MRYVFTLLLTACMLSTLNAQSKRFRARFELGAMGGGSYYIGDLNQRKHFIYSKPAFGLIFRYNLSNRGSLRLTGSYGSVYGSDADADDPVMNNRNLSFSSKIIEVAFGAEFNMMKYRINDMKFPFTPYLFYEIAYFRMNPMASYEGNDIALQTLGTEGQGTVLSDKSPYSLNQISIPLGIGFKFNLRKRLAISIEYGIRKTFTDYIDDVSGYYVDPNALRSENGPIAGDLSNPSLDGTSKIGFNRGNPNNKDWYAFYGVMITFKPFSRSICHFNQR